MNLLRFCPFPSLGFEILKGRDYVGPVSTARGLTSLLMVNMGDILAE